MKLLVDQNLPPKLAKVASTEFPGSCHVIYLQFDAEDDQAIWELAKAEGYIVISKDSDFQHRALTYGAPPKVIHIDRGNCSTADASRCSRHIWRKSKASLLIPIRACLSWDESTR